MISKCTLLTIILILTSCSTANRSMFYGGLLGASIGGFAGGSIGKSYTPDKESEMGNMIVGSSVGIAAGTLLGVLLGQYFFEEDPDNQKLPPMILDDKKQEVKAISESLPVRPVTIGPTKSTLYKADAPDLPVELKDKVLKTYVVEHELPEHIEYLDNGKTIIYQPSKVLEIGHSL